MRARINIYKDPAGAAAAAAAAARLPAGMVEASEEDEEDGEALPEIPLDELLDELEGLGLGEAQRGAGEAEGASGDMMSED
jgi:nonsense-mediated mRNA decay protein 3